MASVLFSDLVDGTRFESLATGYRFTRKFLVGGMFGQPPDRAVLASGIPLVGDPLQSVSPQILCSKTYAMPAEDGRKGSIDKWFVFAEYEPPNENNRLPSINGPCVIEANAITVQKKFFTNNQGQNMYVLATVNGVALPRQPVEVDIPFPMTYLTFRRLEPQPYDFGRIQPFVGAVNVISWRAYQPRQVLCVAIRTKDEGNAVRVSYEFQAYGTSLFINQNVWDITAVYKDPNTKAPITEGLDCTGGTLVGGIPRFRVSGEAPFDNMNLH